MKNLNISFVCIGDLALYHNHSRKHPASKIKKLVHNIKRFGFLVPILFDPKTMEIIAGHARLLAAERLSMEKIPAISIEGLTEAEIRALRIADNKLAEGSEWNLDALKVELLELKDLNFDLSLTAFEIPEIDMIILGEDGSIKCTDEAIPEPPENPIVRIGDIFQVGRHRIACIDFQDHESVEALTNGRLASQVITDVPYNVRVNGHVLSKTKVHSEFAMASGEMTIAEYTEFLSRVFSVCKQYSSDGSLHYHFIDHKHIDEMLSAGASIYDERLNICVWSKTNAGMGSFYRSQHEFCCIFKHGTQSHINNIQLGKFGRHRSNIWCYPGMNTFSSDRDELLASHPTVKNTQMIADAILDASNPGDIVLDGFLGSGTTILAAEQTDRICYGTEIEPKYIEVCINRFKATSDEPVIHIETGLTFEDLKQARLEELNLEVKHV